MRHRVALGMLSPHPGSSRNQGSALSDGTSRRLSHDSDDEPDRWGGISGNPSLSRHPVRSYGENSTHFV